MGGLGIAVLAIILLTGIEFEGLVPAEVVAAMAGAIGFGGAIALQLIGPDTRLAGIIAVAVGMAAAVPAAWLTWRLSRAARTMRTDATPTRQHLVGTQGVVVTQVPAGDGYGEVRIRLGGGLAHTASPPAAHCRRQARNRSYASRPSGTHGHSGRRRCSSSSVRKACQATSSACGRTGTSQRTS